MLTYHNGGKESLFFHMHFLFLLQFQKSLHLKSITETFYKSNLHCIWLILYRSYFLHPELLGVLWQEDETILALRRITDTWGSRSRAWAQAWDAGIQSSNFRLQEACWVPLGKSPCPYSLIAKGRGLILSSFTGQWVD